MLLTGTYKLIFLNMAWEINLAEDMKEGTARSLFVRAL